MLYLDVTADYLLITLGKTQVITTASFFWFRRGWSQAFTWQIIPPPTCYGSFKQKELLAFGCMSLSNPFILFFKHSKNWSCTRIQTLEKNSYRFSLFMPTEQNQILSKRFIWYFRLIKTSFLLLNEGNRITRADIHQKYFELNMWIAFNWI